MVRIKYVAVIGPPAEEEDAAANCEAQDCEEDPVAGHLCDRGC